MMNNSSPWTPDTESDYERLKGLQVVSREGDRLGRISSIIHPDHNATEGDGGHFFLFQPEHRKDWFGGLDNAYLPESAMAGVSEQGVLIDMTEEEIRRRRWDLPTVEGYSES